MQHLEINWLDLFPGGNRIVREGVVAMSAGGLGMVDTKSVTNRDVRIVLGTCGFLVMFVAPIFMSGVAISKLDTVQTSATATAEKVTKLEISLQQMESLKVMINAQAEEIRRIRDTLEPRPLKP